MTRKPVRIAAALFAVGLAVALAACGGVQVGAGNPDSKLTLEQAKDPIPEAPPPLRKIRSQANQLLGGGGDAFDTRISSLKGTPVVVNAWASWCGPCRLEFPHFQQAAAQDGSKIAFIGVNSQDGNAAAKTFLSELPLPYPSYEDQNGDIKNSLGLTHGLPGTAFYDSSGKLVFTRQGQYADLGQLQDDIKRYAR